MCPACVVSSIRFRFNIGTILLLETSKYITVEESNVEILYFFAKAKLNAKIESGIKNFIIY